VENGRKFSNNFSSINIVFSFKAFFSNAIKSYIFLIVVCNKKKGASVMLSNAGFSATIIVYGTFK